MNIMSANITNTMSITNIETGHDMTRSLSLRILAASISIAVGILFRALPEQWIELRFGIRLDGGSGVLEFLLAAIPHLGRPCLSGWTCRPQPTERRRNSRSNSGGSWKLGRSLIYR